MSGYNERVEDWSVTETGKLVTGRRVFAQVSGGSDTLPSLGAVMADPSASTIYPNCIAVSRTKTYYGGDPDVTLWTVAYTSDRSQEVPSDTNIPAGDLPRSVDVGGEFLNIGKLSDATYTTGLGAVEVDSYKSLAIATISVTKIYKDFNTLLNRMTTYGGKANSDIIFGQPVETVILSSASANEIRTPQGFKRWEVTFHFALRCITDSLAAGEFGGWNHVWDEAQGKWDTIQVSGSQYRIYKTADLNNLLNGS